MAKSYLSGSTAPWVRGRVVVSLGWAVGGWPSAGGREWVGGLPGAWARGRPFAKGWTASLSGLFGAAMLPFKFDTEESLSHTSNAHKSPVEFKDGSLQK